MADSLVKTEIHPDRWVRLKADFILLLTAAIWGSGFVAQRVAAQSFGVFLFNGSRFLLGALILLPFMRFRLKIERHMIPQVALVGLALFGGAALQQAGMIWTTAGNAGFITGTYIVLVPLLLVWFWRQRIGWNSWAAAVVALVGILLLSTGGKLNAPAFGDLLEFAGAVLWALHVILVGKLVNQIGVLPLAVSQYLIAGVLNLLIGLGFEANTLPGMVENWWTVVYAGVFSVGLGFTLQAVGQRSAPPTDASIILGMEAVFSALFGALLLGEGFGVIQLLSGLLILAGIILTQVKSNAG